MIPTMSGLARPEILATTEWLAENLGQFGDQGPRPPLATRWQRAGGPRRRPHPGRGARRLADRPHRRRRERRGDPPGRPGPDGRARRPGRDHRRHDGRRLRRHAEPVRGARLVEPAGVRSRSASGSSTAAIPTGSAEGRDGLQRARAAGHGRVHGPRPEPDAPDDVRRPRPARLAGRDPARCPGARRVPRLRGQHQAARPHPGRGQRAGRGDQRARAASGCATGRSCATCSTGPTSSAAGGWSATTGRGSRPPSWRSC